MNSLDQLRQHSIVVADTGDFHQLTSYAPRDATTNPSLILKAVRLPQYATLLEQTVAQHAHESVERIAEALLVRFGREILQRVPGRVSTEVDARHGYDTDATVQRARRLMALYEAAGIARERVLIKIAATWEGIRAAKQLEREGIHCNLTLVFGFTQALACGEAGVRLISPFVGRIYDWHKTRAGTTWDERAHAGANDPGVRSVVRIYDHFKRTGLPTEVMAASFRNVGQILALAGCDLLTISPDLLAQLQASDVPVPRMLDSAAGSPRASSTRCDEFGFRTTLEADPMAREQLDAGVLAFIADAKALDALIVKARTRLHEGSTT